MMGFGRRLIGAALLDPSVYEDVEADRRATLQAVGVVLMASLAGGIGLPARPDLSPLSIVIGIAATLVGWIAWAFLTYLIGTHLLPEPQTEATPGQLLRTIAFSASPGVLRVFGALPLAGPAIYAFVSLWMLAAMIVAVRQALDFKSLGRAVGVCLVGWLLSLAAAGVIGILFSRDVS